MEVCISIRPKEQCKSNPTNQLAFRCTEMVYKGMSVFGEVQDATAIVVRAGRSLCALDMGQSAKMKERELCCASRRVMKHGVKFKLCSSEGEGCTSTSHARRSVHQAQAKIRTEGCTHQALRLKWGVCKMQKARSIPIPVPVEGHCPSSVPG
eukprot:scaffold19838_cov130-Skeletonema_dohrnii-CCMP3373.AAC.4